MGYRDDERAQAVQIGAILLFAALVIALTGYQAFVVPDETASVEFGDFQEATGDVARLQGALVDAAGGTSRTVSVKTGSVYPSRTFSVNPPPASGVLETSDRREINLSNVQAASGEAKNTQRYVGGNYPGAAGNLTFGTKFVEFRPDYNEFDAPPVVASGVAGFRAFEESLSPETGQVLMQGTRITLVTVAGDLRTEGLSSSVTVEPVSAATRTVTITGENGDAEPIGLRLPVSNRTTAGAWIDSAINDSLPGRHIQGVRNETEPNGKQYVNITLMPEKTYTLRIAKVEVREKGDSSVTDDPEEKYVIPVEGDNSSVLKNQTQVLTTEVRDRFNNPVSGVSVSFEVANDDVGGKLMASRFEPKTPGNATITNGEGRAGKVFNASAAGTAYVNSSLTRSGQLVLNETNMTVSVAASSGGLGDGATGANEVNPSGSGSVILNDARQPTGGPNDVARFDIENTGDEERAIERVRIPFYFADQNDRLAESAEITDPPREPRFDIGSELTTLNVSGTPTPISIADGDTVTVDIDFDGSSTPKTDGDFFILVFEFSDGSVNTYFVAIP